MYVFCYVTASVHLLSHCRMFVKHLEEFLPALVYTCTTCIEMIFSRNYLYMEWAREPVANLPFHPVRWFSVVTPFQCLRNIMQVYFACTNSTWQTVPHPNCILNDASAAAKLVFLLSSVQHVALVKRGILPLSATETATISQRTCASGCVEPLLHAGSTVLPTSGHGCPSYWTVFLRNCWLPASRTRPSALSQTRWVWA